MTATYLQNILDNQTVRSDSIEMQDLRSARHEVEQLIQSAFFDCSPTIRYGGSKAKGTMNLLDYDLDIICYFPREDSLAGKTIAEIYYKVADVLEQHYHVQLKNSALKLLDTNKKNLHIDVVPGRFVNETKSDAFLHQHDNPNKEFLKTNLDQHIGHIRDSGCTNEIRLAKLWRPSVGIDVKTFPLELVVIQILKDSGITGLEDRFICILENLRDNIHSINIADPANHNNDLSETLSYSIRETLSTAAADTLRSVTTIGWEPIFDKVIDYSEVGYENALNAAIITNKHPTQPWARD